VLRDAYATNVRELCARARNRAGGLIDPLAELRASGYAQRVAAERGGAAGVAGGWGR
jgi:L-rhamnose isomerase / sugar isomerase